MKENKQEHFIKNIKIKNFKCFKEFKAEGFGRVNLIGGKNNAGKTAFMEACYVCLQKTKGILIQVFIVRNKRNYIHYGRHIELDGVTKPLKELFEQKFKITINQKKKIDHTFEKEMHPTDYIHRQDIEDIFEKAKINIQFLDNGVTDKQLEKLYGILQEENRENILDEYIHELDSSIKKFKFIQSIPKLQVNDKYIHLSNFGDGLKTYLSIICSIFACKNGQLFIDEIDNGIHYTKLDRLWEIILTISKKQNVQVFATTHSKECIESYARVAKRLEDEEITFVELGRNKKDELDSVVMDSEMFQRFIALGNEVRGW
ncbi:MAG: AAA family ATPase [Sulfurovum sp.]|nr:AAA family ATPase [Sulfurovum sp.]